MPVYKHSRRAVPNLIDGGVVDDLIGDMHSRLGVLLARLICHLHCTFHAPAVAVRLRQFDFYVLRSKEPQYMLRTVLAHASD